MFADPSPQRGDSKNILLFKICQMYAEGCPDARGPEHGDSDNNLLFKIADILFVCACTDPLPPSGLAASPPNPGSLVTWTDNSDNETGFEIRYRNITQAGDFVTWPQSIAADAEQETIDTGLGTQDADQIRIEVRAVNGGCSSEWVGVTVQAEILN